MEFLTGERDTKKHSSSWTVVRVERDVETRCGEKSEEGRAGHSGR